MIFVYIFQLFFNPIVSDLFNIGPSRRESSFGGVGNNRVSYLCTFHLLTMFFTYSMVLCGDEKWTLSIKVTVELIFINLRGDLSEIIANAL